MTQFLNASVIGRFRTNLGKAHHFFSVDIEFIFKEIVVPDLKQGYIQTDVGWIQSAIFRKLLKNPIEVLDIINLLQNKLQNLL